MSEQTHSAPVNYPAPPPRRSRNSLVGTSFAVLGMFMYFGVLVAVYLSERADLLEGGGSWIPSGTDISLSAPTVIFWTFLLSIVIMQWAVYATRRNDRRHGLMALVLTGLFGVAVINQFFFIFRQMELEIEGGSRAAPLIYTILGSFILALVVGLIFLLVSAVRISAGDDTSPSTQIVSSAAIYWYSLVFIYFILWLIIFVTK